MGSPIPGPAVSIRSAASADIQNDIATITPHTIDVGQFGTQSNLAMHNNGLNHLATPGISHFHLPGTTPCNALNGCTIACTGIGTRSHPLIGVRPSATMSKHRNAAGVAGAIQLGG